MTIAAAARNEKVSEQSIGRCKADFLVLEDWDLDRKRLAETERRMVEVLDELELTSLVTSIHGISAVGVAAILAETGEHAVVTTGQAWDPEIASRGTKRSAVTLAA